MIPNIEKLSIRRRKMLMGFSFGFGFSLIAFFLNSVSSKSVGFSNFEIIILLFAILGWIFWSYYLIRIMYYNKKIKQDPQLSASLNDEYIQYLRLKSFNIAFWIVLILQGFLYVINMFYSLSVEMVIIVNIFVAVLTAAISFIILDREQ